MVQTAIAQPSLFVQHCLGSAGTGIQLPLMTDLQQPLPWVLRVHQATNLHYDLRFKVGNVLISFTMYNPPSLNPTRWIRARMMGNQSAESMYSERRIPDGQPGAGPTMAVDYGTYVPRLRKHTSYDLEMLDQLKNGEVDLELTGRIFNGLWRLSGMGDQWLLCKLDDRYSSATAVVNLDRSIFTGKRLHELD